jgi:hypothetical protein
MKYPLLCKAIDQNDDVIKFCCFTGAGSSNEDDFIRSSVGDGDRDGDDYHDGYYDGDDYHDDGVEQQQLSLRDPSVVAAYHDCPFRVHATLSYTFLSIIRVGLCDFVLPRHPDITQGQYVAVYSKSAGCVVRGVFQRLFRYREAPLRI